MDESALDTSTDLLVGVPLPEQLNREVLDKSVYAISQKVDELRGKIYEVINQHHNFDEFIESFEQTAAIDADIRRTERTIQQLKARFQKQPLNQVVKSEAEQKALSEQLTHTTDSIAVLEELCSVEQAFQRYDQEMEKADYIEAARALQVADDFIKTRSPKENPLCDAKVFKLVQNELRSKRSSLKATLEALWRRLVVWRVSEATVKANAELHISSKTESASGITVSLEHVVTAMLVLGLLQSRTASLCKDVVSKVLTPLLQDPLHVKPVVQETRGTRVLSLASDSPPTSGAQTRRKRHASSTPGASSEALFTKLQTCVEFVASLFSSSDAAGDDGPIVDEDHRESLCSNLYKPMTEQIISLHLRPTILSGSGKVEAFAAVEKSARAFEAHLWSIGIAPESQRDLSDFVADMPSHLSVKTRENLLAQARTLMLSDNFNTVEVSQQTERGGFFPADDEQALKVAGDKLSLLQGIYELPRCHVRSSTHALVELAYNTLEEMSTEKPEQAVQNFFAVRDMMDLFRAIAPTCHAAEFESVPHMAAIFHNDCNYIAHHLLSLGFQYRHHLPKDLASVATFIDMVPLFRSLGEKHLLNMISRQREILVEFLDATEGFGDVHEDHRYQIVKRAFQRVLNELSTLGKLWRGIMPEDIFDISIGSLVDSVAKYASDAVLRLQDIQEDEANHLYDLLDSFEKQVPSIWASRRKDIDLASNCPSWSKLTQVTEILKMSLSTIADKYKANEWVLTGDELRKLVKALFANSDRRAQFLSSIRR